MEQDREIPFKSVWQLTVVGGVVVAGLILLLILLPGQTALARPAPDATQAAKADLQVRAGGMSLPLNSNQLDEATLAGVSGEEAAKPETAYLGTCPVGMTSFWPLDEAAGPTYADFYDERDATCDGSCPSGETGLIGGAQRFDGSSSGLTVPEGAADVSFDWGVNDSFSIGFWTKGIPGQTCVGSGVSNNEVMIGRDDEASQLHWWLGCKNTNGAARFVLIDTQDTDMAVLDGPNITDGNWHYVVGVRDAAQDRVLLYVDGAAVDSAVYNFQSGFGSTSAGLNFGWLNLGDGFHFTGWLDELAVYNRALSAQEIEQQYWQAAVGVDYCASSMLELSKEASPAEVLLGDTATFTITVSNVGHSLISNLVVDDDQTPDCNRNIGSLTEGESERYTCQAADLQEDLTNLAIVSGTISVEGPDPFNVTVVDSATAAVGVIQPDFQVTLDPVVQVVPLNSTAEITITLANKGSLTLYNVQIEGDLTCDVLLGPSGDVGGDHIMDPGEIWQYSCQLAMLTQSVNGVVIVSAELITGEPVSVERVYSIQVGDTSLSQTYLPQIRSIGCPVPQLCRPFAP